MQVQVDFQQRLGILIHPRLLTFRNVFIYTKTYEANFKPPTDRRVNQSGPGRKRAEMKRPDTNEDPAGWPPQIRTDARCDQRRKT